MEGLFIVTPLEDQHEIAAEMVRHWLTGHGACYNQDRKEAIDLVSVVPSLEQVVDAVKKKGRPGPIDYRHRCGKAESRGLGLIRTQEN